MTRTRGLRLALAAATLLAISAAWLAPIADRPQVASAHAVLVRSSPGAGARLAEGPTAIDLWFSEPLEPDFSSFDLYSSDGQLVELGSISVDQADAFHMSGTPSERLGPGLYTAVYRTLSTQDGHEWTGSFAFTVLNADGSVPAGSAFRR